MARLKATLDYRCRLCGDKFEVEYSNDSGFISASLLIIGQHDVCPTFKVESRIMGSFGVADLISVTIHER